MLELTISSLLRSVLNTMSLPMFLQASQCDRLRAWIYGSGGAIIETPLTIEVFASSFYKNDINYIPKPAILTSLSYEEDTVKLLIEIYLTRSKNNNKNGNKKKVKASQLYLQRSYKYKLSNYPFEWELECFTSRQKCESLEGLEYDCTPVQNLPINHIFVAINWDERLPLLMAIEDGEQFKQEVKSYLNC